MLFKKLFKLLVVGGAVIGGAGCATASQTQKGEAKADTQDSGKTTDAAKPAAPSGGGAAFW